MANSKANKSAENTLNPVIEDKPIVPKQVDPHQTVIVRNGFQGRLVYISAKTKERFVWDEFGGEQEMEIGELRNAKNSSKKFFINNWFMFNDEDLWVVDYLGLKQFYKNAISIDNFDDIYGKKPEDIKKIVAKLSDGQKKSVSYRARTLIENGEIDSRKVIQALEDALGIELIEH